MLLQAGDTTSISSCRPIPRPSPRTPTGSGLRRTSACRTAAHGAQFCWTNAGAQKAFTDNVVAFVRARPDLDILELSGLDGGTMAPACECGECAKHGATDNVVNLLNGVVARPREERPDLVSRPSAATSTPRRRPDREARSPPARVLGGLGPAFRCPATRRPPTRSGSRVSKRGPRRSTDASPCSSTTRTTTSTLVHGTARGADARGSRVHPEAPHRRLSPLLYP